MRLLVAGGGTGGHLFPGIAVARAWLAQGPDRRVLFVGTSRGLESRVLPREGLPLLTIHTSPLVGVPPMAKLKGFLLLPVGLGQALAVVARYRPHVALGVGGYASGPALLAAWLLRRPTLIHEQNLFPGETNRLLGRIVDLVAVAFPAAASEFPSHKVREVGMPLREEFEREEPRPPGFWEGRFRLAVSGGSQGARAINRAVADALPRLASLPGGIEVVHQTGGADREWVDEAYRAAGVRARVEAFIADMAPVLRRAHLVVCRAGALTLAELQAVGAAALLIPFPHAAGGHQEANARHLAEAGAAELLLESELSGERLAERVAALAADRERLRAMGERAKGFARPDAARRIAELCLEFAEGRTAA